MRAPMLGFVTLGVAGVVAWSLWPPVEAKRADTGKPAAATARAPHQRPPRQLHPLPKSVTEIDPEPELAPPPKAPRVSKPDPSLPGFFVTHAQTEGPVAYPIAFQEIDSSCEPMPAELAGIARIRTNFLQAIGAPAPDPARTTAENTAAQQQWLQQAMQSSDPVRQEQIANAKAEADLRFRAYFGQESFLAFQSSKCPSP
jgi:hypothetical protein